MPRAEDFLHTDKSHRPQTWPGATGRAETTGAPRGAAAGKRDGQEQADKKRGAGVARFRRFP